MIDMSHFFYHSVLFTSTPLFQLRPHSCIPTFAFRLLGCRVFTHYYVPSLELLFSPLNICICLCGSFVVYLSLCPRAVLIWIIIWYSQIRSIINYYSKSLKTSTLQNISALCPRLSSHARQHYTFLATSQRKAHIEVAHHRCIISNSSIVIVRGS